MERSGLRTKLQSDGSISIFYASCTPIIALASIDTKYTPLIALVSVDTNYIEIRALAFMDDNCRAIASLASIDTHCYNYTISSSDNKYSPAIALASVKKKKTP